MGFCRDDSGEAIIGIGHGRHFGLMVKAIQAQKDDPLKQAKRIFRDTHARKYRKFLR